MPFQNFVDPSNRMIITMYRGLVTRDEISASFEDLISRSDIKPAFRHLIDFSHASNSEVDEQELLRSCRAQEPLSSKGKCAIVLPDVKSTPTDSHFQQFESLVEAISWLGLDVTILDAAAHRDPAPTSFRPMRRKGKGSSS